MVKRRQGGGKRWEWGGRGREGRLGGAKGRRRRGKRRGDFTDGCDGMPGWI